MRPALLFLLALALVPIVLCEDSHSHDDNHEHAHAHPPPPPPPPKRMAPPSSAPKASAPKASFTVKLPKSIKILDVDLVEQSSHFTKCIPSLATFFTVNYILKHIMADMLKITKFPHTLVGMLLLFSGLSMSPDDQAAKVVEFMEPATTLLTNFLPSFFVPALIVTPLAAQGISGADIARFMGVIVVGLPVVLGFTGHLVQALQKLSSKSAPTKTKSSKPPAPSGFTSWFSPALEKVFTISTAASGLLSLIFPQMKANTHSFYVIATMYSFIFASRIPRHMPPAMRQYLHPLITTYSVASIILLVFARLSSKPFFSVLKEFFVGGGHKFSAAGNFIMFMLEPSIISFAFGLYGRRKLLFANFMPIMLGSFISTVTGIFLMAFLNRSINPSRELKMALLPRATAALAVVQAATIGASTSLTTVNCCVTGILGANFATKLNDFFIISDPIARGLATGCSGLALASAALVSNDPSAFPFGALGMALTSTWATILYSIPAFSQFVISLMGTHTVGKPPRAAIGRQDSNLQKVLKTIARVF